MKELNQKSESTDSDDFFLSLEFMSGVGGFSFFLYLLGNILVKIAL